MFAPDKGTRDLLPVIEPHPDDAAHLMSGYDGSPVPLDEVEFAVSKTAQPPSSNQAAAEEPDEPAETPLPEDEVSSSASTSIPSPGSGGGSVLAEIDIPLDQGFFAGGGSASFTYRGSTGELVRQDAVVGGANGQTGEAGSSSPPDAGHAVVPSTGELDDAHSINVSQIAEVDQDANIFVTGYVGEVVARLYIDQDLFMEQDVDIAFTIDGDGHFMVQLDQETRIDQDISVELKIYDEDGTLYVDVYLRDSIDIEQDTSIQLQIGDGSLGGSVDVTQIIELSQDVDVQIDIEDELEQRYIVNAGVEIRQTAVVDHDAIVGILDRNGEIDLDIDAAQIAQIDQETTVYADFVLI
ncbi:hypothetical protein [Phyllobacterium endophyticum]|uniref:hypothetical protein n=1 Tax=Phyllobacterium endophyticum TaxID=1149773 RepID=UPI0011C9920B|nr:hypothetical protein [Phyllobacterium endophyticum]TXR50659.1 hypothetical protein FVA77_02185 [Phyllobacterium endophyticum]